MNMKKIKGIRILKGNVENKQFSIYGVSISFFAKFFDLSPTSFANSTAKSRYEQALCKFYNFVKKQERKEN